jgi:hypothetical protein
MNERQASLGPVSLEEWREAPGLAALPPIEYGPEDLVRKAL